MPSTFKRSKSFIVTWSDWVGEGLAVVLIIEIAESLLVAAEVQWFLDETAGIFVDILAVPLQITPEK